MLNRGEAENKLNPKKRKAFWNTDETPPAISRAISVIGKKVKLCAAGELEKMLFSFSVLAITINNNQETRTWCHSWSLEPLLHGQCQRLQDGGQRWPGQGG